MTRLGLFAAGSAFYAATLLAWAPATLVDAGIQDATHGRVRLTQGQGTIWAGNGTIEIRDSEGRKAIARQVRWRALPASLWQGRLVGEIQFDGASQVVPIAASWAGVSIGEAELSLPAETLAIAEPRLRPLRLSGDLRLHAKDWSLRQGEMRGALTMEWRDAGSAFSPVSPFGSYVLRLEGSGGTIQARLSTREGPLTLDGSGAWKSGSKPQLQATARIAGTLRDEFVPLLRLISVQRDEETFELKLQ